MTTASPSRPTAPADTDRWLRIAVAVLCVLGLGISGYLTYLHYSGGVVPCTNKACQTVQTSVYSKLDGVPVTVLGLIGYAAILASVLLLAGDLGRVADFGVALAGFLFSGYLTYREIFTIKAICEWCVGSAVLMTLLTIITAIRAVRGEPQPR